MDLLKPGSIGASGASEHADRAALDIVLEAQFIVAWAGELGEGENRRLGWWKTQLGDEYAGVDLFRRLLPNTWEWAVLEAAREAARREDARRRQSTYDPDAMLSLFSLGFDLDERIGDRLDALRRSTKDPLSVFPDLQAFQAEGYRRDALESWLEKRSPVDIVPTPVGRRIRGDAPGRLSDVVDGLLAALLPLGNQYPVPHYRRPK